MPQYANEVPVFDVADKIGAHPLRMHRHIRGNSRERRSGLGPLLACLRGRRVMPSSERDKRLRAELAAELGWYPADLDDESIARQRADADGKKTDHDPAAGRSRQSALRVWCRLDHPLRGTRRPSCDSCRDREEQSVRLDESVHRPARPLHSRGSNDGWSPLIGQGVSGSAASASSNSGKCGSARWT
jgi:hypothetical protein